VLQAFAARFGVAHVAVFK